VTGQNPASTAHAAELAMRLVTGTPLPTGWLRRP